MSRSTIDPNPHHNYSPRRRTVYLCHVARKIPAQGQFESLSPSIPRSRAFKSGKNPDGLRQAGTVAYFREAGLLIAQFPAVDLEDNDIKAVWAYQFARRRQSAAARLALVTLIGIIKDRSGATDAAQTAAAARRFGITTEEWKQVQMEL